MIDQKEFEEFLKKVEDISFTSNEKNKLKAIWNDELLNKVFIKIKNNITNKMISDDLTVDFVKWAIYTIWYLKWILK